MKTTEQQNHKSQLLTKKQQAMVQAYVNDPKTTKTQAYLKAYNVREGTTKDSIEQQASQTFSKPQVKTELMKYNGMVEGVLINTIKDFGESDKVNERTLAVDTGKYVHDKIHGKATQFIETHNTTVNLNLSLKDISQ